MERVYSYNPGAPHGGLGDSGTWTTFPGLHSTAGQMRFEPATYWSQVRHPTARPLSHTYTTGDIDFRQVESNGEQCRNQYQEVDIGGEVLTGDVMSADETADKPDTWVLAAPTQTAGYIHHITPAN